MYMLGKSRVDSRWVHGIILLSLASATTRDSRSTTSARGETTAVVRREVSAASWSTIGSATTTTALELAARVGLATVGLPFLDVELLAIDLQRRVKGLVEALRGLEVDECSVLDRMLAYATKESLCYAYPWRTRDIEVSKLSELLKGGLEIFVSHVVEDTLDIATVGRDLGLRSVRLA